MTAEAGAPTKGNWRNIEPVLKWIAVAYGFGYLIVLVHTYRLGIPMLQLIEPVNVWIGAPLAILAFFLDYVFRGARKAAGSLAASVRSAEEIHKDLDANSDNLENFFYKAMDIWMRALALFAAPFGLVRPAERLLHWYLQAHLNWAKKKGQDPLAFLRTADGIISIADRQVLLNKVEPILRWSLRIAAVARFLNVVLLILILGLACWGYIEAFPSIPQTLGGGRPQSVKLLMSPESLPQTQEFESWRTETTPPKAESKQSILVPVTLYFRTDHDLIVRKGSGPLIALSDHAVEGIVFPSGVRR